MTSKKSKIELPRVYDNPSGENKFKKFEGFPKISYSQIESWNNPTYKGDYIENYFLGIKDPGNIFTHFGSVVGEWFEKGVDEYSELSTFDIETLMKVGRPENCEYEREIVIHRPLGYVIQGFIDRTRIGVNDDAELDGLAKGQVEVIDFKTGNIKNKKDFYASEDYQQTTMYSHSLIEEGNEVVWSGVVMLDRKGNGSESHPLRLTGDIVSIETPYSIERANKFFDKCDKTVSEINEYYKFYKKYFEN
jgi:hypothetical protein